MSDYISNFIESLNMRGDVRRLAEVLLKSEDDCKDFYINYFGRNRYIIFDLLDYRESKIDISDMSFDKFVDMCDNIGIKEAFEQNFLQHFDSHDVGFIESMIKKGRTSLRRIYDSFIENPNHSILKNIL